MPQFKRVVVTGMGAICGLGQNLNDVWSNLLAGKSGISHLDFYNIENLPVKIGGQVKDFKIAEDLLSEKEASRFDRFIHFALHSSQEALKDAGLLNNSFYAPEKIATIMGVGMGGFPIIEETDKIFLEKGARRVSPFFIPGIIPNMAAGLVSLKFNLKGANYIIASACASSAHALSSAALEIMIGRHDVVLTGGAESVLSNLPNAAFSSMKALSKRNDEPQKASRPFDLDRDGFVMGEGAGILVLESLEKAQERGAKIYAEVIGHGATSDAYHITAPHEEGEGAARCMAQAIESAGISLEDIGYINAHGTSTPLGDIGETKAIKSVFKDHAYKLNVSSSKSMTGHLLGGAGGLESIVCIKALCEEMIPPTINLEKPDPLCDLNYTPNQTQKKSFEYALNNSFGFGGTNSSIIFKKFS